MQVLLLISSFQSQVSVCQPGLSSVVCHRVCMLRFIHSFKTVLFVVLLVAFLPALHRFTVNNKDFFLGGNHNVSYEINHYF